MAFCSIVFGCTAAYADESQQKVTGFPQRAPAVYPTNPVVPPAFKSGDLCPCCGMHVNEVQAEKLNHEFPNGYYKGNAKAADLGGRGEVCPCCGMGMTPRPPCPCTAPIPAPAPAPVVQP